MIALPTGSCIILLTDFVLVGANIHHLALQYVQYKYCGGEEKAEISVILLEGEEKFCHISANAF